MTATLSRTKAPRAAVKRVFFTADEAAEYFGVNRETIYRWVKKRTLKCCERNGRPLRFYQEHFDEYLNGPKPGSEPAIARPTRNPKYGRN